MEHMCSLVAALDLFLGLLFTTLAASCHFFCTAIAGLFGFAFSLALVAGGAEDGLAFIDFKTSWKYCVGHVFF